MHRLAALRPPMTIATMRPQRSPQITARAPRPARFRRDRPTERGLFASPPASATSVIALSVFLAYGLLSGLFLFANFSVADLWLFVVAPAYLLRRDSAREYARFLATTGYGALVCLFLSVGFLIYFAHQGVEKQLSSYFQWATIFLLMVPIIGSGLAFGDRPLKVLERISWCVLAVWWVGALLLFGLGRDLILQDSGAGRVFPAWPLPPEWGLALGLAALVGAGGGVLRHSKYLLLTALGLFPAFVTVSRSGLLVAGAQIVVALWFGLRAGQKKTPLLGLAGFALAVGISSGEYFERMGLMNRASGFFEDEARFASAAATLSYLASESGAIWWGLGAQQSGIDGVVTHNVYLQVVAEMGLPAGSLFLLLTLLPCVWLVRAKQRNTLIWQTAVLMGLAVYGGWLFHPVGTLRMYWLDFAVFAAMAWRARLDGLAPRPMPQENEGFPC